MRGNEIVYSSVSYGYWKNLAFSTPDPNQPLAEPLIFPLIREAISLISLAIPTAAPA
jgi:hypothetical protein